MTGVSFEGENPLSCSLVILCIRYQIETQHHMREISVPAEWTDPDIPFDEILKRMAEEECKIRERLDPVFSLRIQVDTLERELRKAKAELTSLLSKQDSQKQETVQ